MELDYGRDAAFPENLTGYPGIILGYFGGPRAFNVWSKPQWMMFPRNYKIPIWVGGLGGLTEASDAIKALKALGVPQGCVILLDMETRIDKTYVEHFGIAMHGAGYKVWVYGSTGTLFNNPQCNGYAVADPTGAPHMYPHPGVRMTQYAFGPEYDNDVIRRWVITQDNLWR
jgi:hypothetical protein